MSIKLGWRIVDKGALATIPLNSFSDFRCPIINHPTMALVCNNHTTGKSHESYFLESKIGARRKGHRPNASVSLMWFLVLCYVMLTQVVVEAYRVGDAVDTAIQLDTTGSSPLSFTLGLSASNSQSNKATTALRNQMPKFGISTKVEFRRDNNRDGEDDWSRSQKKQSDSANSMKKTSTANGFNIYFEDGLRTVEYVPFKNYQGLQLQKLVITFVYSKSGSGMIHSVILSDKAYSKYNYQPDTFVVEYNWKEEAPVRLVAGYAVLFLIVFVASILFLMETCMVVDDNDEKYRNDNKPKIPKRAQAYGGFSKER